MCIPEMNSSSWTGGATVSWSYAREENGTMAGEKNNTGAAWDMEIADGEEVPRPKPESGLVCIVWVYYLYVCEARQ